VEARGVVIDTSIFIDYLRAKNKEKTKLQTLPNDTFVSVSSITLYELYMGATNPQKWIDVTTLTDSLQVLPFNKEVAEKAAIIYQDLRRSNNIIEFRDIFIAATAIVYTLPVWSTNKKHFNRIKDLILFNE
jgi:tRNA(fMet)-specific endonuclease VapC